MAKRKPRNRSAKKKAVKVKPNRPPIPTDVARQVRQECYFGCVLCGSPVFHYDHIEEYAVVKEHKVENLALLCASHHNDKSTKKLSSERVKEARENPYNKDRLATAGHKLVDNRSIEIILGTNHAISPLRADGEFCAVYVNGYSYLKIVSENGWLSLSMAITDINGNTLLSVEKGEIKVATKIFDYTYIGDNLVIKSNDSQVVTDLNLNNQRLKVNKALFIDRHKTGFKVEGDALFAVRRGNVSARYEDGKVYECTGGWAIWERTAFPDALPPNGFGFSIQF
ncbi:HNH endonuclease [Dyadobacter sp. CY323]|uniref:HNH endonuclease n=1 Tax=Dyadobacter sp. CY323 TaxID=2907302 RepID=UPI001F417ED5|nr:HNH endonuclease [Dyadobacter sp. CY323]MCE6987472.1 HNH endonuclease [Dyadobacter sp. CY323]